MLYNIVRYKQNGGSFLIDTGVTLEEAQEHCNDPSTAGEGWFDGYTKVEGDLDAMIDCVDQATQRNLWRDDELPYREDQLRDPFAQATLNRARENPYYRRIFQR